MTREEFQQLLNTGVVVLDGATGTNLQQAGMPVGVCPEQWILENPDTLLQLQRQFISAGAQILYAPTFTGNRIKLEEYGLADRLSEINSGLVQLCKRAADGKAYTAGDLTMTGQQLYPLGDLSFEELVEIYKEQAQVLYTAGVDLFIVETMMSLQETRAAVLAIKDICDLPVMATLTLEKDGRTLYGTPPEAAVVVLQSLGVDAVGLNCSTGPADMAVQIAHMYEYADVPLIAKPNAGLPELVDGRTVYDMSPEEFAAGGKLLVEAGAHIVGGCCGSTPAHLRCLADTVKSMKPKTVHASQRSILASERKVVQISQDKPFQVIGERINPTGKKKLQAELRQGKLDMVRSFARQQEQNGAAILDVNMGTNGIDEKEMMIQSIYEITSVTDLPLCIDSSFPEVIEAALRIYPGRALINSISYETEKRNRLLPLVQKYGAMFIALPLSDAGIPKTLEEKHNVLHQLLAEAQKFGFTVEDIVVDGLVATVGAAPTAALDCLATFQHCRDDLHVPTVCGLSNISFGLPNRIYINTAFLTMAIASGLTMAIANPSQDLLMNAAAAANMLMNKQGSDMTYIHRMKYFDQKEAEEKLKLQAEAVALSAPAPSETVPQPASTDDLADNMVYKDVLEGEKGSVISAVQEELQRGMSPAAIISDLLIPAINQVGALYEQQVYFLPQLIASASTMEKAIAYVEPMLQHDVQDKVLPTIIIATVEGDVHDIGKNLVALMLRNYGYHVIDMGKNVPAAAIVQAAIDNQAAVIGLSALMTTTMMHMKDVIKDALQKGYTGKIIIGGAAVTPSFSDEIGADGYSKDAADCVKLVGKLLA